MVGFFFFLMYFETVINIQTFRMALSLINWLLYHYVMSLFMWVTCLVLNHSSSDISLANIHVSLCFLFVYYVYQTFLCLLMCLSTFCLIIFLYVICFICCYFYKRIFFFFGHTIFFFLKSMYLSSSFYVYIHVLI